MRIMDFLSEKATSADLKSKNKKDIIDELVGLLVQSGGLPAKEKQQIITTLMDREDLGSTGIGQGIGIPHGKSQSVKQLFAAFGLSKDGVDFESLDGEPVHIFFLLIAPEDSAGPHLKALARISRLLKDKYFREMLREAKDAGEVVKIISEEDQKRQ